MEKRSRKRTYSSGSEGDFAGDFTTMMSDDEIMSDKGETDLDFSSTAYNLQYRDDLSAVFKNIARNDVYELELNDSRLRRLPVLSIIQVYNSIFRDMLRRMLPRLPPTASMRIVIYTAVMGNNNIIHVPLTHISEMSADLITNKLQSVIQSAKFEGITSRQLTTIEVGIYIPASGKGVNRGRLGIYQLQNTEKDSRTLKRSVLRVNTDTMCMAKSVYIANCKRQNGNNVKNLIRSTRNNTLAYEALKMHISLGIPLDHACVMNDVQKFEEYLHVRICVVSSTIGNRFLYKGNIEYRGSGTLYLYHSQPGGSGIGHYDVITNIKAFLSKSYFCEACLKGFNKMYEHRCLETCSACFKTHISSEDVYSPMSCIKCHLTLHSEDCYAEHRKLRIHRGRYSGTTSWCSKRWKCLNCKKILKITSKQTPANHICHQKYCKYCKTYQNIDHICYHRSYTPLKNHEKFIFLDFECDVVNNKNECEKGYMSSNNMHCEGCKILDEGVKCLECIICINCKRKNCKDKLHIPNYCVIQRTCSYCINKPLEEGCVKCSIRCKKCSSKNKRGQYKKVPCSKRCTLREVVFSGENVTNAVGQYIVCEENRGCIVMAHNMSRYDGCFLMDYVLKNSIIPQNVIYKGTKCILWVVPKLNLKFIDSLSFLPMSLDRLPVTLGVPIESKKFFPIFFNQNKWRTYKGCFPSEKYFNIDAMDTKKYADFSEWYSKMKDTSFDLQKTLYEYCSHDVTILRTCVLTFRTLVMDLTKSTVCNSAGEYVVLAGIDPFANSITLPQLCQKIFRFMCLKEDIQVKVYKDSISTATEWIEACKVKGHVFTKDSINDTFPVLIDSDRIIDTLFERSKIGQLDSVGNITGQNHSKVSIECLKYYEHFLQRTLSDKIHIQHALSFDGEKKIILPSGKVRHVDGYYKHDGADNIIQFHGCFYHSCPHCYSSQRLSTRHPFYGISLHDNYIRTLAMDDELRNGGYNVVVIWECDFNKFVTASPYVEQFISALEITSRIYPRDALYGGRCEAFKLYCKADLLPENSFIDYYDFVSLYPSVMFNCTFPIYNYRVITHDFDSIDTYFGIAKVRISPPHNLLIPVLPLRINGKLVFTLCKTCAAAESQEMCKCSDKERGWIATYATPEIIEACSYGYIVEEIYEVYHYDSKECYDPHSPDSDHGLFTEYIKIFLREKTHASGYPDTCDSTVAKEDYILQYKNDYGIVLDPTKIVYNQGKRAISKTFLNSLWGIYAMKENSGMTTIVGDDQIPDFVELMSSATKKVTNFHIVSDEILQVEYKHVDRFAPQSQNRHVILGLFVTMYARLKLNKVLQDSSKNILYCDTDSVIRQNISGLSPRESSRLFGELANELCTGETIQEFVSTGSKTYSYVTSFGNSVVKAKGFYLDNKLHDKINLPSMLQLVNSHMHRAGFAPVPETGLTSKIKVTRDRIKKCKYTQKLCTTTEHKTYSFVYTKRIICPDYTTLPFGWQE